MPNLFTADESAGKQDLRRYMYTDPFVIQRVSREMPARRSATDQQRPDVFKDEVLRLELYMQSARVDNGSHPHTNLVKACRRRSALAAKAATHDINRSSNTGRAYTWSRAAAVISIMPHMNYRTAADLLPKYWGNGDGVVDRVTRYLNILAANPGNQAAADEVFDEGKAQLEADIEERDSARQEWFMGPEGPGHFM